MVGVSRGARKKLERERNRKLLWALIRRAGRPAEQRVGLCDASSFALMKSVLSSSTLSLYITQCPDVAHYLLASNTILLYCTVCERYVRGVGGCRNASCHAHISETFGVAFNNNLVNNRVELTKLTALTDALLMHSSFSDFYFSFRWYCIRRIHLVVVFLKRSENEHCYWVI